ncbi:MAG TPA: ABC transporter permease subunit [Saprospiraceae bacterium]|nr:ABC transporter permease subunit [Saprospiraceae bacterium]
MNRIARFVFVDILKNSFVIIYAVILFLLSSSVLALEDNSSKGVLSMLNIILLIVPLVSIIFSTIYIYNSAEFVELLLSQPVKRTVIWRSLFYGLSLALSLAFVLGAGVSLILFVGDLLGLFLFFIGILLTLIFTSFALLCAVWAKDKAKGIGLSILVWLFFSLFYDGLLVFGMFQFSEYPLEKLMMVFTLLNPIDLSRILILLQLDVSALLGYTSAVFKEFLGSQLGIIISFVALVLWFVIPYFYSLYKFNRKDL